MKDVTAKNFGLLIAYVLPGAIALIGLSRFSSTVVTWLTNPIQDAPTVGGFLYVTLASVGAGMTASAVRWVLVDTLFHHTGLVRPVWDDSKLAARLEAFEALVENHYRYYQFHANSLVALLFSYIVWRSQLGRDAAFWDRWVLILSGIFVLVARDNLRNYYRRGGVLLGIISSSPERSCHEQRPHSARVRPERGQVRPEEVLEDEGADREER